MEILLNMDQTATAAARLLMPSPPTVNGPTNYVSMFRIDGAPILPPLMTTEKRKQMKKLKEKAMELEKKLEAKRCHKVVSDLRVLAGENDDAQYSSSLSELCPSARSNFSNISQSSSEVPTAPDQDSSYLLLSNLMQTAQEGREFKDSSTCTKDEANNYAANDLATEKARLLKARLQKLQKSETLIYDNCSNSIIMPIIESEQNVPAKQKDSEYELQQALENPNLGYRSIESNIPVICINPPTPMIATRSICEQLHASMESLSGDLLSPDTSEACSSSESTNPSALGLKAHKKVTNITAKIIQFETFCDGGSGVLERLEPPNVNPPLRSATSPSLKPSSHSPKNAKKFQHKTSAADSSEPENPLVRSNSFTLDVPSKALLDHIRQQKFTKKYNRSLYPSASATRDTVESKAKRVQKVEVKQRLQTNRSPVKTPTLSPYVTKSQMSAKKQRSPYELKPVQKTKSVRPVKATVGAVNSTSATALHAARHARPKNSLTTLTAPRPNSNHNKGNSVAASKAKVEQEFLTEIEAEHRQKFVQLVAKQNEEKKRLQLAFETQQKLLLDQICEDMDKVQVVVHKRTIPSSPHSSQDTSPTSAMSDRVHKPPLSLNSSCNSYSMVSSTINDASVTANEVASMNSTMNTTPTPQTNQRQCTPRRRLFSCDDSPPSSTTNLLTSGAAPASTAANKRPLTFTYK